LYILFDLPIRAWAKARRGKKTRSKHEFGPHMFTQLEFKCTKKKMRRKMGHPPKTSMIAIFLEKSIFALIFLKNRMKNG